MRHLILAFALLVTPLAALAAGGHGPELEDANIDLKDKASLQRGAKYFVNYCMGCHSLQYMRYQRMADDLEIPEDELRENLLFGDAEATDMMTNALKPADGEKWFGTEIPDLTLVTRWRSPDWVYSYLKAYYVDDSRPYGVNNLVFPDVGMPHPFAHLQGIQAPVYAGSHGEGHEGDGHVVDVKLVEPGQLTPGEYDAMVRDITNFLTYVGEPYKLERRQLGLYVLLFLGLLFILAFYLKREFWKDVH
ncbi:cytochrome c1 [Halochromatium glycolicum]|jgi:ubiquinol-cytochrome c reductase cytochrome c1 subunit|uniref:Cytochrome c1 n=1 Tax=Halochromatium glycolicum TaxID=85075 RepID=A0AAJ0U532_9GAMM|nr:cytochrome c1 [Halochromatium glycolicum]MBK1705458.1 cytochrome c1 [Halochromatium glycolicum]